MKKVIEKNINIKECNNLFAGGGLAIGANIILAPVYLRLLNNEEYGHWSQFQLLSQMLQPLLGCGLMAAMSRLTIDGNNKDKGAIVTAALALATFVNIISIFSCIYLVNNVISINFLSAEQSKLLVPATVVAALAVYPSILMGIYIADGKAIQYRSVSIVGFMLQTVFLVAFMGFTTVDLQVAIESTVSAAIIFALVAIGFLISYGSWNFQIKEIRQLIIFGVPIAFYTLGGQFIEYFTRYRLSETISATEFGFFNVVFLYASLVSMLSSAVNLAWIPIFYRNAEEWMYSGFYRQYIDVFIGCMAVFAGGLITYSNELLTIYSGKEVLVARSVITILIISAWLNSAVWMSLTNPMFYKKTTSAIMKIVLCALIFTVPVVLFSIELYKVTGATLALLLNSLLLNAGGMVALNRFGIKNINQKKIIIYIIMLLALSANIEMLELNFSSYITLMIKTSIYSLFVGLSFIGLRKTFHQLCLELKVKGFL